MHRHRMLADLHALYLHNNRVLYATADVGGV